MSTITEDGRPWALVRTVGSYSGGTRVTILEMGKVVSVRVHATDEVIEVAATDLVKLRRASDVLTRA